MYNDRISKFPESSRYQQNSPQFSNYPGRFPIFPSLKIIITNIKKKKIIPNRSRRSQGMSDYRRTAINYYFIKDNNL